LRIPPGAREAQFKLNGEPVLPDSATDGYFGFRRTWSQDDRISMEFDVPVTVPDFMHAHYGIVLRGPEVLAVDQQDNPGLDLDQITLPEQITLSSSDPVNGRRRYQGKVKVGSGYVPITFTPYADCGNDGSFFRVAFPK
jgi:DUF1680 family protein